MQHNYEDVKLITNKEKELNYTHMPWNLMHYEWFLDSAKAISLHEMQNCHYVMECTTPFMVSSATCIIVSLTLIWSVC